MLKLKIYVIEDKKKESIETREISDETAKQKRTKTLAAHCGARNESSSNLENERKEDK